MKPHTPVLVAFSIVLSLWFVAGPLSYMSARDRDAATSPAAVVATSVNVTIPRSGTGITKQVALTQKQLLARADVMYAEGVVPIGDNQYSTSVAKKGSVYLCNARQRNAGQGGNSPWIDGDTWSYLDKPTVSGAVSWPNAQFRNTASGTMRTIITRALPVTHATGIFPVSKNDPAALFDANPNSISAQSMSIKLPVHPVYSETPYCMGGEVGIMLTGVPLFNAFDAGLRDAPAHELHDACGGHPQQSGTYHYHNLSSCINNTGVDTVLGYAYDGFPITGAQVADGKYLTTDDLDECHGITSDVVIDGVRRPTYHYVMTVDFPYSAGCFRAQPVTLGQSAIPAQSRGNPRQ